MSKKRISFCLFLFPLNIQRFWNDIFRNIAMLLRVNKYYNVQRWNTIILLISTLVVWSERNRDARLLRNSGDCVWDSGCLASSSHAHGRQIMGMGSSQHWAGMEWWVSIRGQVRWTNIFKQYIQLDGDIESDELISQHINFWNTNIQLQLPHNICGEKLYCKKTHSYHTKFNHEQYIQIDIVVI